MPLAPALDAISRVRSVLPPSITITSAAPAAIADATEPPIHASSLRAAINTVTLTRGCYPTAAHELLHPHRRTVDADGALEGGALPRRCRQSGDSRVRPRDRRRAARRRPGEDRDDLRRGTRKRGRGDCAAGWSATAGA